MPDNEEQAQSNTVRKFIGMHSMNVLAIQGHLVFVFLPNKQHIVQISIVIRLQLQYVVKP